MYTFFDAMFHSSHSHRIQFCYIPQKQEFEEQSKGDFGDIERQERNPKQ